MTPHPGMIDRERLHDVRSVREDRLVKPLKRTSTAPAFTPGQHVSGAARSSRATMRASGPLARSRNARWTGVAEDVLDARGVKAGAVEVRFNGLDEGDPPGRSGRHKSLAIDHAGMGRSCSPMR